MAENAIIALIIGVILLVAFGIAVTDNLVNQSVSIFTQTDEPFVVIANQFVLLDNDDLQSTVTVTNASQGAIPTSNYTVQLDKGRINVSEVAFDGDTLNATYTYKPDNYIESGATRNILKLLVLLLAVGVIVFVTKGAGLI